PELNQSLGLIKGVFGLPPVGVVDADERDLPQLPVLPQNGRRRHGEDAWAACSIYDFLAVPLRRHVGLAHLAALPSLQHGRVQRHRNDFTQATADDLFRPDPVQPLVLAIDHEHPETGIREDDNGPGALYDRLEMLALPSQSA